MIKEYTYTYTRAVEIDFDLLINRYGINEENDLKEECQNLIRRYLDWADDIEYWLIHGHEEEIACDLYNYIQSKTY